MSTRHEELAEVINEYKRKMESANQSSWKKHEECEAPKAENEREFDAGSVPMSKLD